MKKVFWMAVLLVTAACGSSDRSPEPTSVASGLAVEVADHSGFRGSFLSSAGSRLTFQAHTESANSIRATVASEGAVIASAEPVAGQEVPDIKVVALTDPATKGAVEEMIAELKVRYQGKDGIEAAHALYVAAGLVRAVQPTLDSTSVFRSLTSPVQASTGAQAEGHQALETRQLTSGNVASTALKSTASVCHHCCNTGICQTHCDWAWDWVCAPAHHWVVDFCNCDSGGCCG